jgi:hypothetical protein
MSRARLATALAVVSCVALSAPVAGGSSPTPKRTLKVVVVGHGFVVSTPTGIACPPRCSSKFPATAKVTLRVRPEIGFVFKRWQGACRGRARCALVLPAARTVVAVFDLAPTPPPVSPPPPAPPPPPPPPPPAPPATPGHYVGKTSHLTNVTFDVLPDSSRLVNFRTGQINESCTPGASLSGGNIGLEWMRINLNGSFGFSWSGKGTVDNLPSDYSVSIAGRFAGGVANGTIRKTTAFTHTGTAYSCDSGTVTWTATRSG